jgi:hypothetical protein
MDLAVALFVAVVVCGLVVPAGCSAPADDAAESEDAVQPESTSTGDAVDLTQEELTDWGMSVSDKQTRFAEDFPWQAPVIDGLVVVAEVDSDGTHLYRIEVDRPVDQVAEWHRRSYPGANWVILDERTTSSGGLESTVLEVAKGQGAWSRILIEGDDTASYVEASIGVGTPPTGVF